MRLKNFKATGARVLFGAEPFCWPNPELAPMYPKSRKANVFSILDCIWERTIEDEGDDQLYFTEAYLDETFRNSIKMKLDHTSTLFQNLHRRNRNLRKRSEGEENPRKVCSENYFTHTRADDIHGNGFRNLPSTTWATTCRTCGTPLTVASSARSGR
nr:unnamed protein product [Callosobruchus chinensis]